VIRYARCMQRRVIAPPCPSLAASHHLSSPLPCSLSHSHPPTHSLTLALSLLFCTNLVCLCHLPVCLCHLPI
jgi:hypothetical protein